jgi:hypothetical protein
MSDKFHVNLTLSDDPEKHKLCRDWLLDSINGSPSGKTRTKNVLRIEAMEHFKISKSAFERAWTWAAEEASKAGLCVSNI